MKKVAFICVHNSYRSQIAEALGQQSKLISDEELKIGIIRQPSLL